ncbi:hypothetical protein AZE42_08789 [Rhizopogon vesiculosus]|uniref:Uncharacterized protein n=1 Tax=Rhizopogon vesiculosus TaxID=180088 RepID=A0A1J8QGK4_9AGAM|nr:hypothetical protein AZE42_08789 [Rhizopogon vesiculosus]
MLDILGADPNLNPRCSAPSHWARVQGVLGILSERSPPGNHGSFQYAMNLLELEMFHQIKNVIGVYPTFFEYLFTVDADTTVEPYSVNDLVSA